MLGVAGLIGNTLSFCVLCSPVYYRKSYSYYLRALAIFDSLTLIITGKGSVGDFSHVLLVVKEAATNMITNQHWTCAKQLKTCPSRSRITSRTPTKTASRVGNWVRIGHFSIVTFWGNHTQFDPKSIRQAIPEKTSTNYPDCKTQGAKSSKAAD